jgi:succinyl-diaminopimelate desuccinylase
MSDLSDNKRDDLTQNSVTLMKKLCSVNTVNPPGNEAVLAELVSDFLKSYGLTDVQLSTVDRNRANLIARITRKPDTPALLFAGHLDVVPAGNDWESDPFDPIIEGDRLYARGSSDMKSGLVAIILMMKNLHEDKSFTGNVIFLATADEEVGCSGIRKFLASQKARKIDAAIIGEPSLNSIGIGEKGALWLKLKTTGISAHGSCPEDGKNAIDSMISIIQRISFQLKSREGTTTSCNIISGGNKENVIPDRCEAVMDFRFLDNSEKQYIADSIKRIAIVEDSDLELEELLYRPAFVTGDNERIVITAHDAIKSVTGEEPHKITLSFFSDGAFIATSSIPTLIIGPGDPSLAHKANEHVSLSKVEESVKIYCEIARKWFSEKPN